MCNVCSKRKVKTVINGPISNFLTVGTLNQLPQRQEIGPRDCIEMIGKKRQRELMEDELSHSQDHCNEGDLSESESEESKHEHPQKRRSKTSGP